MTDREIKAKRRQAAKLTRQIDTAPADRTELWIELRDAGVSIAELAEDSGIQAQAVRRVLRTAGAM